jgi:hypothetical protein
VRDTLPRNNCMEFFDDTRKIVVVEEKNRKYVGENSNGKSFTKYRVDGCLIIEGKKCDYMLINNDESKAYFIELKGRDLIRAVEQIECTIDEMLINLKNFEIYARIVLTKVTVPDIKDSKYIRLERKIKKLKGDIKQGVNTLKEQL